MDVDVEVHGGVCVGLEGRAVALHRFELLAASFLRCGLASNLGCAQGGTGQAVVEKPSLEACRHSVRLGIELHLDRLAACRVEAAGASSPAVGADAILGLRQSM